MVYSHEKYIQRKEAIQAAQKRCYLKHREKRLEKQKKYDQEHKEEISKRHKEYYKLKRSRVKLDSGNEPLVTNTE